MQCRQGKVHELIAAALRSLGMENIEQQGKNMLKHFTKVTPLQTIHHLLYLESLGNHQCNFVKE